MLRTETTPYHCEATRCSKNVASFVNYLIYLVDRDARCAKRGVGVVSCPFHLPIRRFTNRADRTNTY